MSSSLKPDCEGGNTVPTKTSSPTRSEVTPPRAKTTGELLDKIKNKFEEQLDAGEIKLKVGDIVKILELQKKLTEDSGAEDKFWEMIEQIRQKELKDA
jgi:hypothetical protein